MECTCECIARVSFCSSWEWRSWLVVSDSARRFRRHSRCSARCFMLVWRLEGGNIAHGNIEGKSSEGRKETCTQLKISSIIVLLSALETVDRDPLSLCHWLEQCKDRKRVFSYLTVIAASRSLYHYPLSSPRASAESWAVSEEICCWRQSQPASPAAHLSAHKPHWTVRRMGGGPDGERMKQDGWPTWAATWGAVSSATHKWWFSVVVDTLHVHEAGSSAFDLQQATCNSSEENQLCYCTSLHLGTRLPPIHHLTRLPGPKPLIRFQTSFVHQLTARLV